MEIIRRTVNLEPQQVHSWSILSLALIRLAPSLLSAPSHQVPELRQVSASGAATCRAAVAVAAAAAMAVAVHAAMVHVCRSSCHNAALRVILYPKSARRHPKPGFRRLPSAQALTRGGQRCRSVFYAEHCDQLLPRAPAAPRELSNGDGGHYSAGACNSVQPPMLVSDACVM